MRRRVDRGRLEQFMTELGRRSKSPGVASDPEPRGAPGPLREEELADLPGAELVLPGLRELRAGEPTEGALLVLIAGPRLRELGIDVPERSDIPRPYEHRLYELLEQTHGAGAYSRYGSLIRRVVSFSRALQHRRRRLASPA